MKKLRSLAACALAAPLALACGGAPSAVSAAASTTEQAIINGDVCAAGEEPTAMAIMLDATIDFGQGEPFDLTTVLCTGTLIAPDVVILAAHCLDTAGLTFGFGEVTRADFYVTFEEDLSAFAESAGAGEPLPIPASAIPVREGVANPSFDINQLGQGTSGEESDIALLFLSTNITDVRPEVVITSAEAAQLAVGTGVTIAGWGQQTNTGGGFEPPPAGTVGIKRCGASTIDELGQTLMQIGADPDSTRKCHGDSGGPTYVEVQASSSIKRRVIGVTSRAYDASDCAKGGVDTRVDAFLDWIDDEMSQRCENGTRTFCDVPGIIPASFFDGTGEGEGEGEGNEGEGEGNEGEGEGEGEGENPGCPGCAGTPVEAGVAAALALLLRRRRRA